MSSVAVVSNRELFVVNGDKFRKKSARLANAMALELLNYGIVPDQRIVDRISCHKRKSAKSICDEILKMFTIGDINPPLFSGWEDRVSFTFTEFVVQIFGYRFQISGNDLEDPSFMQNLRRNVDFKGKRRLNLADSDDSLTKFLQLVNSNVALDKPSQKALVSLAKQYHSHAPSSIKSAEARIAVLVGSGDEDLYDKMQGMGCRPADVLRYAAVLHSFDGVKLPSDVKYGKLRWAVRVDLMSFLMSFDFEFLCEEMGDNREAWRRFFGHVHVFKQSDFRNRFTKVVSAALVSVGSKVDSLPVGRVNRFIKGKSKLYDVTDSGNIAYRTFASRIQTSVDNQDFDSFASDIAKRPGYLFRNIGSLSRVCTKKTESDFVDLFRSLIDKASSSVLFSIIQIDVNSDYRIIDSKGNTTVKEADYSPVIGEIQGLVARELYGRHGFEGKVKVAPKLRNTIVPFLSTNADLDRGSRIPFEDAKYLYFLMHWVQSAGRRTDLDHSYVCFDSNWNAETIYFGNQANSFISQSGDITNAPAPHGGTEYGKISLKKIPPNVKYVVPIMTVYSGDAFSLNETAYAGLMFSNDPEFSIRRKHTRFDMTQPAMSNIPFVIDVEAKEVIVVDFNNRLRDGLTAHSSISEIKKVIAAMKTKKFMTIERFAKLLSGDESKVSLTIKPTAKDKNEIEPNELQSLIK